MEQIVMNASNFRVVHNPKVDPPIQIQPEPMPITNVNELLPEQVLCGVKSATVCGSDLEQIRNNTDAVKTLLHECKIVVLGVGSEAAKYFKIGDPVIRMLRTRCKEVDGPGNQFCTAANCALKKYVSWTALGMRRYFVAPYWHLRRVPDELGDLILAVEPAAVVAKAFATLELIEKE